MTTVDPALVGGFCYTSEGNFNSNDYNTIFGAGFGAVEIDKDQAQNPGGNPYEAWLTGYSSATSGNWTVA